MAAASTAKSVDTTAPAAQRTPKSLRGQNKPKCVQCGNVARSRCPYMSCQNCCAKAQNPCHIHVLKANATSDKTPTPSTPLFDAQKTEVTPPGASQRAHSVRQRYLKNLTQFNNVQSVRARKPLTSKDAVALNEWRFSKLVENKEGNIEVENEGFDRYMQNVGLLEEVFSSRSILEESVDDVSNPSPSSDKSPTRNIVSGLKLKLKSNPVRIDNFRNRIQVVVDHGLKKLKQSDTDGDIIEANDEKEIERSTKKLRAERTSSFGDLIERLNKVRNENDLKSCVEMKSQLCNRQQIGSRNIRNENVDKYKEQPTVGNDLSSQKQTEYSFPKFCTTTVIDEETLKSIDAHFSSLEQVEDL